MRHILVPLDGSVLADRAIPWADELAGALGAEIRLIRILTPNLLPPLEAEESVGQPPHVEELLARRSLVKSKRRFRRVQPTDTLVRHGPAGELIAAHAQVDADLVVMASHSREGLARALLGSVTATVIGESGIPVLVIPSRVPIQAHVPERIFVPLDGSPLAEGILDSVIPLALGIHATLFLFGVLPPEHFLGADQWSDLAGYLETTAQRLRNRGVPIEAEWHVGAVGGSIVEFAHRRQVDLIAMRTHGRRGLERWISGSVTEHVLAHAELPVLVDCPAAVGDSGAGTNAPGQRSHAV